MHAAAVACLIALACAAPATAQDTVAAPHALALDTTRLHPWSRSYDMLVRTHDSSVVVGRREVRLDSATYAGAAAWLVVETRTGSVPAAESLYLSRELRPMHWSSTLGPARLAIEFVGDSLLGAATAGRWKENIALPGRRDALVNGAMVEVVLSLLPLSEGWTDSAATVSVGLSSVAVLPSELVVLGSEGVPRDTSLVPAWVVAVRSPATSVLYWVERGTDVPMLIQQALPDHVGRQLEFRPRPALSSAGPP